MVRTRRVPPHATAPGARPGTTRTSRRPGRPTAVLVAVLLGLAPVAGAVGAAHAEPPGDDEVAAAEAAVDAARLDVAGAQDRLDAIRAELAAAEADVQTAATGYTQAAVDLAAAREATAEARVLAETATAAEAEARAAMAEAYRTGARSAGTVGPLTVVTAAESLDHLSATGAARRAVERKIGATLTAQADARAAAQQAGARWGAARDALVGAEERAAAALTRAEAAVAALEARTATAEQERDALYTRLAELRSTSVRLERERDEDRQAADERTDERRARDDAGATAAPAGDDEPQDEESASGAPGGAGGASQEEQDRSGAGTAPEPAASGPGPAAGDPAPDATRTSEPERTSDPEPEWTSEPEPERTSEPEPERTSEPEPDPAPLVAVGRSTAAQGREALAWARARIGVEYQWGGEGNPGYDCSGLTSQAWNAAGLWITRTTRTQYQEVAKIPYDEMRPGDLIFYANDTSDPSTIRHVAIYAGGGMMVEAPRPGIDVRETAIRWTDVMPSAGRP